MPTLLLDRNAIKSLMRMSDVINVVEDAFRMCGEGRGKMPAKTYLSLEHGDFRAMPAALPGCAGVKWVNVHPQNPSLGLPSIMAILVYNDPETGYPLAIMDATESRPAGPEQQQLLPPSIWHDEIRIRLALSVPMHQASKNWIH